jgi:hypothetical protein
VTAALEALRAALAAGHWYCLSAAGQAMLCVNEEDARNEAEECDRLYPQHAPHRAVQLVPAAPELLAEVDRLKAEREALRAKVHALLWDEHAECCGAPVVGAEYMGQQQMVCCGCPERVTLNDAQIVATLRELVPETQTQAAPLAPVGWQEMGPRVPVEAADPKEHTT